MFLSMKKNIYHVLQKTLPDKRGAVYDTLLILKLYIILILSFILIYLINAKKSINI